MFYCHSYEGVKRDIDLYFPKVKDGGVVGGHDFNKVHFGIHDAVMEFIKENKLKIYWGYYDDWWIIKP